MAFASVGYYLSKLVDLFGGINAGNAKVENVLYKQPASGEIAGSATAKQLPGVTCKAVIFQALASNTGNVYIGGPGVTIPDGAQDATSGIELDSGAIMQAIPTDNINHFYIICDNVTDDLAYMVLR